MHSSFSTSEAGLNAAADGTACSCMDDAVDAVDVSPNVAGPSHVSMSDDAVEETGNADKWLAIGCSSWKIFWCCCCDGGTTSESVAGGSTGEEDAPEGAVVIEVLMLNCPIVFDDGNIVDKKPEEDPDTTEAANNGVAVLGMAGTR